MEIFRKNEFSLGKHGKMGQKVGQKAWQKRWQILSKDKQKALNLLKVKGLQRFFSGERGIRTPDTSPYAGFQDRCNRPLYHLSNKYRPQASCAMSAFPAWCLALHDSRPALPARCPALPARCRLCQPPAFGRSTPVLLRSTPALSRSTPALSRSTSAFCCLSDRAVAGVRA